MESSSAGHDSLELILQFFALADCFASPARLRQRTPTHSLYPKLVICRGRNTRFPSLAIMNASLLMKHFYSVGLRNKNALSERPSAELKLVYMMAQ